LNISPKVIDIPLATPAMLRTIDIGPVYDGPPGTPHGCHPEQCKGSAVNVAHNFLV
jgi:hypothetical protein